MIANPALQELLSLRESDVPHAIDIKGDDPCYATRFRIGATGAAVLASTGAAIADLWAMRSGCAQSISVDALAAAAALNSYAWQRVRNDHGQWQPLPVSPAAAIGYQICQPFRCADGRHFLPHFGIRHLKERMLRLLECEDTPQSVARAVARWRADELDEAVASIDACGAIVRSESEWLRHPQGRALADLPAVTIEQIGESEPQPLGIAAEAMSGVRILDLTRILAGPVAARTCAEYGADVLMVAARHTPQMRPFVIDLSHGKRSCYLDLNVAAEHAQLMRLAGSADVFVQSYRPGVLQNFALDPYELISRRPGLIYASVSCYGAAGPFANRGGWDQLAQASTGICAEHGGDTPALLPAYACDYLTGYLGAFGIALALRKRALRGGSYHVQVSLCQSAMLLQRNGRVECSQVDLHLREEDLQDWYVVSKSDYGELRHLKPVIGYCGIEPRWRRASPALGSDRAEWL